MNGLDALGDFLEKAGGPFIGPKGGKWADAKHTIAWKEGGPAKPGKKPDAKTEHEPADLGKKLLGAQQHRNLLRTAVETARKRGGAENEKLASHFEGQAKEIDDEIRALKIRIAVKQKPTKTEKSMSGITDLEDYLSKGGEGSRGGHVVGHTAGGKPIYDSKKVGKELANLKTWVKTKQRFLRQMETDMRRSKKTKRLMQSQYDEHKSALTRAEGRIREMEQSAAGTGGKPARDPFAAGKKLSEGKTALEVHNQPAAAAQRAKGKIMGKSATDGITGLEDYLSKAAGHKYTSKKPDGKGGWIYTYADEKSGGKGSSIKPGMKVTHQGLTEPDAKRKKFESDFAHLTPEQHRAQARRMKDEALRGEAGSWKMTNTERSAWSDEAGMHESEARKKEVKKSQAGLSDLESYWQKSQGPRGADDLRKSFFGKYPSTGRSDGITKWADQFYSTSQLQVDALKLVKEAMAIDAERDVWNSRNDKLSWRERQDLGKTERDAYDKKVEEGSKRFDDREAKVSENMAALERKLVDAMIDQAKIEAAQKKVTKSLDATEILEDYLSKSQDGKPAEAPTETELQKSVPPVSDTDAAVMQYLGDDPVRKSIDLRGRSDLDVARARQAAMARGQVAARDEIVAVSGPGTGNAASLLNKARNVAPGYGSPTIPLLNQHTLCKSCGTQRTAVLTTCPSCGGGHVVPLGHDRREPIRPAKGPHNEVLSDRSKV